MSKSAKLLNKYRGYKFFREIENNDFEVVRLIDIEEFNDKVVIENEQTGIIKSVNYNIIGDQYTPLKPFGVIGFNAVKMKTDGDDFSDVFVTVTTLKDAEIGLTLPHAVCRQGINDFFNQLINTKTYVGVSASQRSIPTNIPFKSLLVADEIIHYDIVNFYIDDTLDTILHCIDTELYDNILEKDFDMYIDETKRYDLQDQEEVRGWCKNLKRLLISNNFMGDVDETRSVINVDFNFGEEIDESGNVSNAATLYLSCITELPMVKATSIMYYYDIDFGDFRNQQYLLLRDNQNVTYIVSYDMEGQYNEKEFLENLHNNDPLEKFRLKYFDKYNTNI